MGLFSKKQSDVPRRRLVDGESSISIQSNSFRRNRTLVNSATSNLEASPRMHVHHLSIKRRKLFGILLISIVIIAFLALIISNFTSMPSVSVSDTTIIKPIEKSTYEKAIQNYLNANPLGRFHFFLDRSGLNDFVATSLPEVESVVQKSMVGIGVTDFNIKLREPVAGWKINDKQYYVDAKGVPFERNYFAEPTVRIIDSSGASVKTGEASVSKRFLGFVGLVVSLAKSSGYTVTQAVLPYNTTRQLDITLKDINLLVKMSIDRPAGEQVEDMSRAVKYLIDNHNQLPSYIDVRVSGKAFYK